MTTDLGETPDQTSSRSAPREAVLFVNTKSRRGQEWFGQAQKRLLESGIDLKAAKAFRSVKHLKAEVKHAIDREVPLVIAGGGDGTFSAIANSFVGSKSALGVLPLGTGNAFARDLGIPADVEIACRTIATGKVSAVDLGLAGGYHFLNVATLGLTTQIARELTDPLKKKWGRFVYAIALSRALSMVKPFRVRIETEEVTDEFETLQLVIGVGHYHAGPFPVSPHASITSGKFEIYALATTRKIAFLKLALRLPTGHQGDLPEVRSFETTGGRIITTPPGQAVTIDGEVCARTPFKFSIAPRALRVVTPMEFHG